MKNRTQEKSNTLNDTESLGWVHLKTLVQAVPQNYARKKVRSNRIQEYTGEITSINPRTNNNLGLKKPTFQRGRSRSTSVCMEQNLQDIPPENELVNQDSLPKYGRRVARQVFKSISACQHERQFFPGEEERIKSMLTVKYQRKLQHDPDGKFFTKSRRSSFNNYDNFYNDHDFVDTTAKFISRDMKADMATLVLK